MLDPAYAYLEMDSFARSEFINSGFFVFEIQRGMEEAEEMEGAVLI